MNKNTGTSFTLTVATLLAVFALTRFRACQEPVFTFPGAGWEIKLRSIV